MHHFSLNLGISPKCTNKWINKKTYEFKRVKLDTRANLELATAVLHDDVYNMDKQGEVNRLWNMLEYIEGRKAKGAAIRSRVKWQKIGDKCTKEFFKSVRQKKSQAIILELRDTHGQSFTKVKDLTKICLDFYTNLYKHKKNVGGSHKRCIWGTY